MVSHLLGSDFLKFPHSSREVTGNTAHLQLWIFLLTPVMCYFSLITLDFTGKLPE
jgi:hypothetical protein